MAEVYDKIIQGGRTSFVPRSQKTRAFWTKYNANIARSQNAALETVTIMPASDAENANLNALAAPEVKATPKSNALEVLQKQLADQQALINQLLLGKTPVQEAEPEAKEKGKPGPKPKTNTDGESKQTEDAKA